MTIMLKTKLKFSKIYYKKFFITNILVKFVLTDLLVLLKHKNEKTIIWKKILNKSY